MKPYAPWPAKKIEREAVSVRHTHNTMSVDLYDFHDFREARKESSRGGGVGPAGGRSQPGGKAKEQGSSGIGRCLVE